MKPYGYYKKNKRNSNRSAPVYKDNFDNIINKNYITLFD
jgi:hypothetical protein